MSDRNICCLLSGGLDSTIVTALVVQQLGQEQKVAASIDIEVDNLKAGVLDTDLSDVAAGDTTLASAKAVKTYVDDQLGRFGGIFKHSRTI